MELDQGSAGSTGSVDSGALESAVSAISDTAPKLSGLDKLKEQKASVEKTGELPAKTDVSQNTSAAQPAVTPPAYTPDFKYKASGKEMEIPEKFRALITDKESEEEVKKLFGQAATLDEVKGTNTKLKTSLDEVGGKLNEYASGVEQLRKHASKGDFDSFFQKMNIPAEKIFQWVLDKVNYNQLPADQRAQIDAQRNLQRQNEQAQESLKTTSTREMQLASQVRGMELERTLGEASTKAMSDAFDSRAGKPGAFRDAIINHGKAIWALSNGTIDLTPEQAVADFVQKYGNPSAAGMQTPAAGAASPTPAAQSTTPSANAQPPVKVIPNVAGRSSSPVKQAVKSIADLQRIRKGMIETENAGRSPSQGYLAG